MKLKHAAAVLLTFLLVSPTVFAQDAKQKLNDEFWETDAGKRMIAHVPMRRLGQLEELDGALLLLASRAGSFMTGSTLVVDGGHLLPTE